MQLFEGLKEDLDTYLQAEPVAQVEQAYFAARDAHEGQFRSSGDPYITHPVAAARILAELHLDHETIMAALLHDVIEDCHVSRVDLETQFGEQVADLVEGVSKLTKIKFSSRAEAQAENFRKMMMAMVQDIRVILIKLADRLHNMRTLGALRPDKRRRIARETLEIYAPIAHRLGIYRLRAELEELGFAALYPMRYKILRNAVTKARGNRRQDMEQIRSAIEHRLTEANVHARVISREKSLFSIYRKMRRKVGTFTEVMDIYGFRVICDNEDACYRILGQVHNLYKPVPGRFKDYIAIPKANGYQSLHTTLRGPRGLHIEAQIRTENMDRMAENGVAAHWLYKSGGANPAETRAREWMQNLMELQTSATTSIEFVENVKIDLFPDEVYVFTPKGRIIELPKGSTPVDFAYAIHTDIGNHCIAAKIDRQYAPLSSVLHNGQTLEVVTAPGARPNPAWLSFVVTGKARANIRHFVKTLRQDEAIALGKRLLEQALDDKSLDDFSDEDIQRVVRDTRHHSLDDLLENVGFGQIASVIVAHRLNPETSNEPDASAPPTEDLGPLAIKGTEGLVVSYGKCCRPIPGDPIIAFVSAGRGFVIHRENCSNIQKVRFSSNKYMPVQWAEDVEGDFEVGLKVEVFNQRGVLAQLTSALSGQEANIVNIAIDEQDGQTNTILFLMKVHNRVHVATIIKKLRVMPFVNKALRYP